MLNSFLFYLICYLFAGCGMYCAAAHESLKLDRGQPPTAWFIWCWPIVYLLGIVDLIDWITKEIRNG